MPTTTLESVLQGELALCIFEESNDAFIVFDPRAGQIVEINPTTQRLTGLRRRQLIDRSIRQVIRSERDDGLSTLLKETSETGFYQVREGYFLRGDGEQQVPVSITVSRLHVEPRPLALIIAHDMTKRRQLQSELREVERQLDQNRRLASLGEPLRHWHTKSVSLCTPSEIFRAWLQVRWTVATSEKPANYCSGSF